MAEVPQVVIIGGHGKVALLAAPKLTEAGFGVTSLIRNPDHAAEVEAASATPKVLDVEQASTEELTEIFAGAQAVVFSAGAGGGNPARTRAVDYDAAVRTMDAAVRAGVPRYVMVSFARAETLSDSLDPEDSFYPYAVAKREADEHLRGTNLDYSILGPGRLTLEPATGKVQVVSAQQALDASQAEDPASQETSRDNVAEVIAHVLTTAAAKRATVNFFDGETPITEAIV